MVNGYDVTDRSQIILFSKNVDLNGQRLGFVAHDATLLYFYPSGNLTCEQGKQG